MGLWEAIWKSSILGAVQGLTEFLPVSSSGHLTLLQHLLQFDLEGGSMTFINIMMHLGTLIAVIVVFWKDILALFKKPFKTLLMLIAATIPAGVVGLLFNDEIDALFSGENAVLYLSVCFALTALLLLICEMAAKRRKVQKPLGWGSAAAMGLMQAVALFPGISRSGSTIVAGTLVGTRREDVAKFSFLMSIPVILGSFAVEVFGIVREPSSVAGVGANGVIGMAVGVVLAAVFGFFAIKLMLRVIRKANYVWFSVYLTALSVVCFSLCAAGVLPLYRKAAFCRFFAYCAPFCAR